MSPLYVTLLNDFDKTFVHAFLKIELNCDKNMFISNACSFQKKMLSN